MSKIRDFFRTVVGPDEADAGVNTPAPAPPPPDALAPAATADFAGTFEEAKKVVPFLPALAAGARTVGGVLLGAGAAGVLGPAALVTGGAIVVAGVIIAGAGAISSADERADPIDDEGVNEGGVPVSSGFDGGVPDTVRDPIPEVGAPDTERDPIPEVIPEGEEPAPDTDRVPKPGDPDFPKDVPKPPLLPTFSLEADPSVIDQGAQLVQGVVGSVGQAFQDDPNVLLNQASQAPPDAGVGAVAAPQAEPSVIDQGVAAVKGFFGSDDEGG